MTEPHPPAGPPYEVIIPDDVMAQIRQAPPEVADHLAAAIAHMRQHGPEAVPDARPLFPHPVDHSPGRPTVHVPAARSVSYLRGAVADISPPTVATFDQELTEDTAPDAPHDPVAGLRSFALRWIEFIAIQGDHDRARHIEAAQDSGEFTERFSEAMAAVRAENFPDARDDPNDLSVRTARTADGHHWAAVCPITMLRTVRNTEEEALLALHGALLEMLTGF